MDATGSILHGFRLTDVGRDVFIKSDVNPRSSILADVAEGFAFLQTFDFGFGLQALDSARSRSHLIRLAKSIFTVGIGLAFAGSVSTACRLF